MLDDIDAENGWKFDEDVDTGAGVGSMTDQGRYADEQAEDHDQDADKDDVVLVDVEQGPEEDLFWT